LHGFALAARGSGNAFVAYGWEKYVYPNYNYTVQVARSANHGASFLYGTADQYSTADPNDGMLVLREPDIEIGPLGTAHLVYAMGYNPGSAVLYKYSFPPYSTWSAESVQLDDSAPQASLGLPRLAVGAWDRQASCTRLGQSF
jgi:hypothetical protein